MIPSLIQFFEKKIPSLSQTEQIALEAGDVWWEGDIFSGAPNWETLSKWPTPKLSAEEADFLANQVNTLCEMADDWAIYKTGELPEKIWQYLKSEKFFGLIIPKKYGGREFSAYAHSMIVSRVASRSLSVAISMMVPNSLGPAELLLHYGTEAQKDLYLPLLAKGEKVPCFALTGVDVGSDASRMTDVGIVMEGEFEGKKTLGISLTFDKRYITLSPLSSLLGLAFKLKDPQKLLGGQENLGITLALIPLPYAGIQNDKKHYPLGMSFPNGVVRGKNVFIPIDWIIGGVKMAGHGWQMLMECLSIGRSISLPALSAGTAQMCLRTTGAYAFIREQFRMPIGQFEGVEQKLAQIGGFTYLIEAARRFVTIAVDDHKKPSIASAITKYHVTEMGRIVINAAMDIHGGRGVQMGPRNYLALPYIGVPVSITVEGANILTRNLIIFGQGAMRCHPYLRKEMQALLDKDHALFKKLLISHIGFGLKNLGRLFFTSRFDRMSAALAFCTDISLLILGGELKRRENVSARLGDVLSYIYLYSCVKKYHQDFNHPENEQVFVQWSEAHLLYQSQIAFTEFCDNFPNKIVGKLLKWLIFPFGKRYAPPSDALNHEIAKILLSPSPLRDKISHCAYPVASLEKAFEMKIQKSAGYEAAVQEAIKVDEF